MFDPVVAGPLGRFLDLIDSLGIRYVTGGSVASSLQGMPRQTIDLDVVIELEPGDVGRLVTEAARYFYVSEDAVRGAVRHKSSFNLIHAETAFKVDIYVSDGSAFDRAQFDRAIEVELPLLGPRRVKIASAEDVVLRKLEWFKLGNEVSDRQWYDLMGVLKVQGQRLDFAYLNQWARARGLASLLDRAKTEAGL